MLDICAPCGNDRRLWQGTPEGRVKPVGGVVGRAQSSGHVKLAQASAGQQELRDRTVEIRAGATSDLSRGLANPSTLNVQTRLF